MLATEDIPSYACPIVITVTVIVVAIIPKTVPK